jgi:hypothetical protein
VLEGPKHVNTEEGKPASTILKSCVPIVTPPSK